MLATSGVGFGGASSGQTVAAWRTVGEQRISTVGLPSPCGQPALKQP